MSEFSVVGKPLPRVDAVVKVTGDAKYAGDLVEAGMLYGKILRSPYAHAKILNIDTSKAEKLPGVRAIVVGKDFPDTRYGMIPQTRDEPHMARDKVRFIDEGVAAVAAIDEDIAEEALDLIEVEYEPIPAVFDAEEAMKDGAPLVHEDKPHNIALEYHYHFGDVGKGFNESERIYEDRFTTNRTLHAPPEPHATLIKWDVDGKLTMQASKQSPYLPYRVMSQMLEVPLSKMRLINPHIGSGYGAKNDAFTLDFSAALLSKKTGRPVKIVYSQRETITSARRRVTMVVYIKTGVKKDGTLVAREFRVIADSGAYTTIAPITMYLAGNLANLPYRLPNLKYDAYRIYTNKPACAAYRGHGLSHTHFAAEVQLDMIAEDLGIDRVEIRRRNALHTGEETANKIKLSVYAVPECIDRVVKELDWEKRRKEKKVTGNIARGIGFASSTYISGLSVRGHKTSHALVRVTEDGTVFLMTGSTDCGQGSNTVLSQMAAEVLGVSLDDVHCNLTDTDFVSLDPGTYSSRITFVTGHAVVRAAESAKKQLAVVAAEILGAKAEDIEFKDRKIFVKGKPEKVVPFRTVARTAIQRGRGNVVFGEGRYALNTPNLDLFGGWNSPTETFSCGFQAAEVEVDLETGQVRFVKSTIADDHGVEINPAEAKGQLLGCQSMALGIALTEEIKHDENGLIRNPTFVDYKLPRLLDHPKTKAISMETYEPVAPFGIKECGEGNVVSTIPAIINAIHDATGVWIKDLPATPEKVLKAIKEKMGKKK